MGQSVGDTGDTGTDTGDTGSTTALQTTPMNKMLSFHFSNKLQKLEDALVEQMLTSAKCAKL